MFCNADNELDPEWTSPGEQRRSLADDRRHGGQTLPLYQRHESLMIYDSKDESTGEDFTGPRMLHISYKWHGPGQGRSYKVIYTGRSRIPINTILNCIIETFQPQPAGGRRDLYQHNLYREGSDGRRTGHRLRPQTMVGGGGVLWLAIVRRQHCLLADGGDRDHGGGDVVRT